MKNNLHIVRQEPDRITVDMGDVETEYGSIHVKIEGMPREVAAHVERMARMTGEPKRTIWARLFYYSSEMSERASKRRRRS